jgi:hypothetical protein
LALLNHLTVPVTAPIEFSTTFPVDITFLPGRTTRARQHNAKVWV